MLKLEHLNKSFDRLSVLQDFSLEVKTGEILALIGPSGCGKSTLLNIITGLENADSGQVICKADQISYMFQGTRLLPWRTVYENIRLVRENTPKEKILGLIESVGLKGFEDFYPGQLSGGMAKRCALARAFHYGGQLLLMDEPFQGLDYGLRMEMLSMLLTIWEKTHPSVLFVTHEIDEALTAASRIAVLTSRPTGVKEIVTLPGKEGRDASAPELAEIRQHIIHQIS